MKKPTPYQVIAAKYVLADALDRPDYKTHRLAFREAKAIHDPYSCSAGGAWTDAVLAIGGDIYGTFAENQAHAEAILREAGEAL